jgi:hypothetical protein
MVLPPPQRSVNNTSNLLFIKDKVGGAGTNNITVGCTTTIDGQPIKCMNINWSCLILMFNNNRWHIANYYTNNINRTTYQNEPNAGTVNKQTITIFNTDKTDGQDAVNGNNRKSGDNVLTLSSPAALRVKVVIKKCSGLHPKSLIIWIILLITVVVFPEPAHAIIHIEYFELRKS